METRVNQLTDDNTIVEISKKGVAELEEFTPAYLERMGVHHPSSLISKLLWAIPPDNIPALTKKSAKKTGLKLLLEYGSLEGIITALISKQSKDEGKSHCRNKEIAFLSRSLSLLTLKLRLKSVQKIFSYQDQI